ncbi:MAG TPA: hypothetical protein DEB38_01895 [Acidimicrobiaceae bacterium]|nr:hypothetical protein [Acidimicrobiaceae bacterium]|tara:strand:+ start:606 stop:1118 length:513 start_codon:yes stop_codon:yes gene_type:complete
MRIARLAALMAVGIGGCVSSAENARPLITDIPEAISTLESTIGSGLQYFEVSADLKGVTLVVAETVKSDSGDALDMFAKTYRYEESELTSDGERLPAEGATFRAAAIDIDPAKLFNQIDLELFTPVIIDVAVQGAGDGSAIVDATVVNEKGGTLLVLLSGDGRILGVQAS